MNKKEFDLWFRGQANSCPVENCKKYRISFITYLISDKFHILSKDNRKDLRTVLGKPDAYWNGEFYFHVWIREFEDEKFIIMTAKNKGTCIEICNTSIKTIEKKGDVIIRFMNDLYSKLKKVQ